MNPSFSFGHAALAICLGGVASQVMILLEDDLTLKVTCPARKSTCPGLPDGTFFEP